MALLGHATDLVLPIDAVAQNTLQSLGYITGQCLVNTTKMALVKGVTKKGVEGVTKKNRRAYISPSVAKKTFTASIAPLRPSSTSATVSTFTDE